MLHVTIVARPRSSACPDSIVVSGDMRPTVKSCPALGQPESDTSAAPRGTASSFDEPPEGGAPVADEPSADEQATKRRASGRHANERTRLTAPTIPRRETGAARSAGLPRCRAQ